MNAGVLYFNDHKFDVAEGYLKKAATLKPRDANAHFYLARSLHEQKKALPAEASYRKALETGYDKGSVCYNLGYLYEYEVKDYEKALENYKEYLATGGVYRDQVQKKVDSLDLWVTGQKYEDAGDYKKAQEEYEKALAKEPHSLELYTRLGRTYRKNNKFAEAERVYLRALDQFHDDYYVLNNLGSLYFSIERLDDAEGCWNAAIRVKPNHPSAHFNIAVLLEKRNKPKEAEKEYLAALKHGYEKGPIYLHLAELYENALGDNIKALGCYEKIMGMGTADKESVQKKIERLKTSWPGGQVTPKPVPSAAGPPKGEPSKREPPKAAPPKAVPSVTETPKAEPTRAEPTKTVPFETETPE